MHVIKPQPVITFHSFSFAVSQRGRAAAKAASSSTGAEEADMKEKKEVVLRHKHPSRFLPPLMPRTIHLWQVPEGQTVNFNKLWVTVPDKKSLLPPSKLSRILP